jgi:hypothetical protein
MMVVTLRLDRGRFVITDDDSTPPHVSSHTGRGRLRAGTCYLKSGRADLAAKMRPFLVNEGGMSPTLRVAPSPLSLRVVSHAKNYGLADGRSRRLPRMPLQTVVAS